jgi:hypothetical protein
MAMEMDPEYKKRMRIIADKRAKKKGKMDPEGQPGFKPIPFLSGKAISMKPKKSAPKKKSIIPRSPTN